MHLTSTAVSYTHLDVYKRQNVAIAVGELAAERGMSSSQLGLLWVMEQPGVTAPIIGPRTMQHLEDALPLLEMRLADDDRPRFDALVPVSYTHLDVYKRQG